MSSSRLRLNPLRTVVIWLGSRQQVGKIDVHAVPILNASVSTVNTARDLGVILDSELTMSAQVSTICRSGFFQFLQLRPVVRSLSTVATGTKTLVQAFISNRLDHCQFASVQHHRQLVPTRTSRPKRRGKFDHWCATT